MAFVTERLWNIASGLAFWGSRYYYMHIWFYSRLPVCFSGYQKQNSNHLNLLAPFWFGPGREEIPRLTLIWWTVLRPSSIHGFLLQTPEGNIAAQGGPEMLDPSHLHTDSHVSVLPTNKVSIATQKVRIWREFPDCWAWAGVAAVVGVGVGVGASAGRHFREGKAASCIFPFFIHVHCNMS